MILIIVIGAKPSKVNLGPVEFDIPTPTIASRSTITGQQPTEQPTPQQQTTSDLWQFYVDIIKESAPNAPVTVETLKSIAAQIPISNPYFAEVDVGLVPYQYNGNIIDREGSVSLNAPEGGMPTFRGEMGE